MTAFLKFASVISTYRLLGNGCFSHRPQALSKSLLMPSKVVTISLVILIGLSALTVRNIERDSVKCLRENAYNENVD